MANIAQTVNVLQAMILTDPATGALVLTPTYHVFEMNTGHHDAASLEAHVIDDRRFEDVPLLSASASTTGESALISLSNLDAGQARPVVLDLRGQDVSGYGARILTSGSLHDHNDPSRPNTVRPRPHEGVSRHEKG